MKLYFDTLIKHCTDEDRAPIYFVRYEDLCERPEDELNDLFAFILDKEKSAMFGTNCWKRINDVIEMGDKASQSYKLKDTTGKFNYHAKRYNEEQIQFIKDTLGEYLYFFGYAKDEDIERRGPGSSTYFFDFGADYNEEHSDKLNGFRKVNMRSVEEVCGEYYTKPKREYVINQDTCCDVMDAEDLRRNQEPSKAHTRKQYAEAAAKR